MFSKQTPGQRPVGVKIADSQTTDFTSDPDLTLKNLAPIEFFAAQYVEKGRLRTALFCHSGGMFYLAPEGDSWLQKMRPLSERLTANVKEIFERRNKSAADVAASVPRQDAVDVIAESMSEG